MASKNKETYKKPENPNFKSVKYNSIITIYNNTAYAKYVEKGTEKMEAQPMVSVTEIKIRKQAEELCNLLSIERIK